MAEADAKYQLCMVSLLRFVSSPQELHGNLVVENVPVRGDLVVGKGSATPVDCGQASLRLPIKALTRSDCSCGIASSCFFLRHCFVLQHCFFLRHCFFLQRCSPLTYWAAAGFCSTGQMCNAKVASLAIYQNKRSPLAGQCLTPKSAGTACTTGTGRCESLSTAQYMVTWVYGVVS